MTIKLAVVRNENKVIEIFTNSSDASTLAKSLVGSITCRFEIQSEILNQNLGNKDGVAQTIKKYLESTTGFANPETVNKLRSTLNLLGAKSTDGYGLYRINHMKVALNFLA